MKKTTACLLLLSLVLTGCATGRDMTSAHYIPEWENRFITLPEPSDTSAGYWAVHGTKSLLRAAGSALLVPFALVWNLALNAYYIPTWPVRRLFRGDRRLVVWHPVFTAGTSTPSHYYTQEWNRDLV